MKKDFEKESEQPEGPDVKPLAKDVESEQPEGPDVKK